LSFFFARPSCSTRGISLLCSLSAPRICSARRPSFSLFTSAIPDQAPSRSARGTPRESPDLRARGAAAALGAAVDLGDDPASPPTRGKAFALPSVCPARSRVGPHDIDRARFAGNRWRLRSDGLPSGRPGHANKLDTGRRRAAVHAPRATKTARDGDTRGIMDGTGPASVDREPAADRTPSARRESSARTLSRAPNLTCPIRSRRAGRTDPGAPRSRSGHGARHVGSGHGRIDEADIRPVLGSACLSALVVVISPMGAMIGIRLPLSDAVRSWTLLALTTPIVFWCGRIFLAGAFRSLASRHLDMSVLIAVGVLAAYVASVYLTILGPKTSSTKRRRCS